MKHNERSLLQKAKQIPRIALVRKAPPALMLEIQEERQTLQENGLISTEQENSEK